MLGYWDLEFLRSSRTLALRLVFFTISVKLLPRHFDANLDNLKRKGQMNKEEASQKIIVALDVSSPKEATGLVRRLNGHVGMYKLGLEFIFSFMKCLMSPANRGRSHQLLDEYCELFELLNGNIFLDGKLHDIPNTVEGASLAIAEIGVKMFNVHCTGGRKMMSAARKIALSVTPQPKVLGVTALTSLTYDDMVVVDIQPDFVIEDPVERERVQGEHLMNHVRKLGLAAQWSDLDGVICSPKEIRIVRKACRPGFIVVTPGVRPAGSSTDDQKRFTTPSEAVKVDDEGIPGADYLVIGRPITKPPTFYIPETAADAIAEEIAKAMG
jgi:orotidine-5'-phosphate decarboxylase